MFFFFFMCALFILAAYTFDSHSALVNNYLQRYVDKNVSQNWGYKKFIMQTTDVINDILPKIKPVSFVQNLEGPGTSPFPHPLPDNVENLIIVKDSEQLINILNNAQPGDAIFIQPGTYKIYKRRINVGGSNIANWNSPSYVFASRLGDVEIDLATIEGFYIDKPNWTFQNLIINGICEEAKNCEHAFHMVGNADNTIIANNIVKNFNSHLKSNGALENSIKRYRYPNNVYIFNNAFFNEYLRPTDGPTTPIDVVGGNNWLVEHNFITDFSKALYKHRVNWSYGLFLKGGGENGVVRNNLVACEWKVPHFSKLDARVGISFGGGGTDDKYCQHNICTNEHSNGKIIGNTIVNCTNDSAIYLNKSENTLVENNIIYNSLGIEARFPQTTFVMRNNEFDSPLIIRGKAKRIKTLK